MPLDFLQSLKIPIETYPLDLGFFYLGNLDIDSPMHYQDAQNAPDCRGR